MNVAATQAVVSRRIAFRSRPTIPPHGDADDIIMKRLILLAPLAVLAACGSSRGPESGASAEPMVYASSARPASEIARCLNSRLSRVHVSKNNGVTDLTIGSSSNSSYFISLTPSGNGSVIKVVRGTGDDPPEEELRFAIARCTT
ncbi:conserved hypothetical protein [Paraburkholderia piptadeniae]|uniref:Sugar ABC transporter ATPase n=2 Tax=Paraburkholderia piptadeniae TaxID=1701573 RepID=A0A1N7SHQ3_9BURK|nr:conserved hypothetical protein [Paraburkholderia piptadeniae]